MSKASRENNGYVSKLTFEIITTSVWDYSDAEKLAAEFSAMYGGNLNIASACLAAFEEIADPRLDPYADPDDDDNLENGENL